MGMRDLYPFALSVGARRRIEACWLLAHPPRPPATAGPTWRLLSGLDRLTVLYGRVEPDRR